MRIFATSLLALWLFISLACGGSSSPKASTSGPLSGNWQFNLVETYPAPTPTQLSVSGFLIEGTNSLSGSVQVPAVVDENNNTGNCGGVGQMTGTISGQTVNLSVNPGGTTFNFTGSLSSDNRSMSGTFQALGGACLTVATTGSFTASIIPPLNGNFTGTLTDSSYMAALTGLMTAPPITVSGSMAQTANVGGNSANVTGTIMAVGYPCFSTASVTGTISGGTLRLSVYGYTDALIGNIGEGPAPATVGSSSGATSITAPTGGLTLGQDVDGVFAGPCPVISDNGANKGNDTAAISLTFQ